MEPVLPWYGTQSKGAGYLREAYGAHPLDRAAAAFVLLASLLGFAGGTYSSAMSL